MSSAVLRLPVIYPTDVERPRVRGECADGPRPCPWVSCRHHLALDVTSGGVLNVLVDVDDLEQAAETCVLDVADRAGMSLEEISHVLKVTRERVRQIEEQALGRAERDARRRGLTADDAIFEGGESDVELGGGGGAGGHAETAAHEAVHVHARTPFASGLDDDGWTARVWARYLRSSADHGFEETKGKHDPLAKEKVARLEAGAAALANERETKTMGRSRSERSLLLEATFRKLETSLGREPTCAEVAKAAGLEGNEKTATKTAQNDLGRLRLAGILPRIPRGPYTKPAGDGSTAARKRSRAPKSPNAAPPAPPITRAKPAAAPSSTFEDALRAERERLELRLEKVVGLLTDVGSS